MHTISHVSVALAVAVVFMWLMSVEEREECVQTSGLARYPAMPALPDPDWGDRGDRADLADLADMLTERARLTNQPENLERAFDRNFDHRDVTF